jgi:copper chaperone CopZ
MRTARVITLVTIDGMRTEHCKRAVFTSLAGLDGITLADVQIGTVQVEHDGTVTFDQLRDAIAVAGYAVTRATEQRRVLPITDVI